MTAQPRSRSEVATAGVGAGPAEAVRIGWRRARSFNVFNRGARSWTGALIPVWLWPMDTLVVAASGGHVRRLGGASMTLTDGTAPRLSRPVLVTAGLLLLGQFAMLLAVTVPLSLALLGSLSATWAVAGAVVVIMAPLLVELVARVVRLLRSPEVRSLSARRRELAASGGPVFVMSSFVRASQPGEGARLLRALQQEWQGIGAVVLFNPANETVADYYTRYGAVPDGTSRRVMRFDYRETPTVPGSVYRSRPRP